MNGTVCVDGRARTVGGINTIAKEMVVVKALYAVGLVYCCIYLKKER